MPLSAGTRVGPFEILSVLGAGAMGEAYRARDTKLQREVALKLLPEHVRGDTDRLARFAREARSLAALSHPNIGAGIVTIATIIQDKDGAEVSREMRDLPSELFETNRIVEHRATLPLARLQPGEYLLTFEARSGSQMAQGCVRFTVDLAASGRYESLRRSATAVVPAKALSESG